MNGVVEETCHACGAGKQLPESGHRHPPQIYIITVNSFIFAFTEHETITPTISSSLVLLAIYPDVQNSVAEQLEETHAKANHLTYANVSPQTKSYPGSRVRNSPLIRHPTAFDRTFDSPSRKHSPREKDERVYYRHTTQSQQTRKSRSVYMRAIHIRQSPPNAEIWDPKRWIESGE